MIGLISGNDQLPAFVERNLFLLTVFGQQAVPTPGELGFETVGGIIEPGMQDTAVAAARVQAAIGLFFEEMHRRAGKRASKSARNVQPDHASADDEKIRSHVLPHFPRGLAGSPHFIEIVFLAKGIHARPKSIVLETHQLPVVS